VRSLPKKGLAQNIVAILPERILDADPDVQFYACEIAKENPCWEVGQAALKMSTEAKDEWVRRSATEVVKKCDMR
jgi:hypothetical protein